MMPLSRLELISSHGDQTLANIRFVMHGTANGVNARAILNSGLHIVEGRPTVSTNIVHAQDWTVNPDKHKLSQGGGTIPGDPGLVIVAAIPANFYLGHGVFTTAYIDRALKRVSGAPLRYASARKQLAFYMQPDTEMARVHIEAETANGYPLNQRPQFIVEPKFLIGTIEGAMFSQVVKRLDVSIRSFEALNYTELESEFRDLFRPTIPEHAVLVPAVIRDMIIGTAESIVISRMRMMRWQGLALLGYAFAEGQQEMRIPVAGDVTDQRRMMDDTGRRLASSGLFTAELAWLKTYVANQLELMRVELDGAELEAIED